jgi:hypothetical protein
MRRGSQRLADSVDASEFNQIVLVHPTRFEGYSQTNLGAPIARAIHTSYGLEERTDGYGHVPAEAAEGRTAS